MIENINLIKREYKKDGKKWVFVRDSNKIINWEYYKNIIDAKSFFVNLGGYERHEKSFTRFGRIVVKVISINPTRDYKSEYVFNFNNATRE